MFIASSASSCCNAILAYASWFGIRCLIKTIQNYSTCISLVALWTHNTVIISCIGTPIAFYYFSAVRSLIVMLTYMQVDVDLIRHSPFNQNNPKLEFESILKLIVNICIASTRGTWYATAWAAVASGARWRQSIADESEAIYSRAAKACVLVSHSSNNNIPANSRRNNLLFA